MYNARTRESVLEGKDQGPIHDNLKYFKTHLLMAIESLHDLSLGLERFRTFVDNEKI